MPNFPYIDDFSDSEIYVLSTLGKGPKGDKGDPGDTNFPTYANPIEWDPANDYDSSTVVEYAGSTYISKKQVPHGIDIDNNNYWQLIANYNAQIEELGRLLPSDSFSEHDTVKAYIDSFVKNPKDLISPYWEFEKVAAIENNFNADLQSMTNDLSGNLYIYYDSSTDSYMQKIRISDFTVLGTKHFASYLGHGNSMCYDAVKDCIVLCSSNRTFSFIDTNLNLLYTHTYASGTFNAFSQFILTSEYAVANISGTNTFIYYNRLGQNMLIAYRKENLPLPRFVYNSVQDACVDNRIIYHAVGSNRHTSYVALSGINGTFLGNLKTNVTEEFEGITVYDGYIYLATYTGSIYKAPIPNATINAPYSIASIPRPDIVPIGDCLNFAMNPGLKSSFIRIVNHVQLRFPNVLNLPAKMFPTPILKQFRFINNWFAVPVIQVGGGDARIRYSVGKYYIQYVYTISGDTLYQYLSQIVIDDSSTTKTYNITDAITDADFATILGTIATDFPDITFTGEFSPYETIYGLYAASNGFALPELT